MLGRQEQPPQQVLPRLTGAGLGEADHAVGAGVGGEHVGARIDQVRRPRVESGDPRGELRRRLSLDRSGRRRDGDPGEIEEMDALGGAQCQHARERVEHGRRRRDIPALLQPRVPRQTDPGERGELLAAQSRRASARAVVDGEADRSGRRPLTQRPQEHRELLATGGWWCQSQDELPPCGPATLHWVAATRHPPALRSPAEHLPRLGEREQQGKAFGRGQQDLRRGGALPGTAVRGRVAGPRLDPDGKGQLLVLRRGLSGSNVEYSNFSPFRLYVPTKFTFLDAASAPDSKS